MTVVAGGVVAGGGGSYRVEGGMGGVKYRSSGDHCCLRDNNNQFVLCPFCDFYFHTLLFDENKMNK